MILNYEVTCALCSMKLMLFRAVEGDTPITSALKEYGWERRVATSEALNLTVASYVCPECSAANRPERAGN